MCESWHLGPRSYFHEELTYTDVFLVRFSLLYPIGEDFRPENGFLSG